ncbi:MAG: transporter substrate-binding domain-containing protein [Proteocatella sp.]
MLILVSVLVLNQFFIFSYNVDIAEYFTYSKGFTEEELNTLKKYSPLIYGGNINDPPLGMYYEENGQYLGLVVDHISALSIQLGEDIIAKPMVWEEAMEALKKGETDMCDMIPSEERSKYYEFTDPIYNLSGAVVVKKGNEAIVKGEKWENVRVGIQKSDYALEHIKDKVDSKNIFYAKDMRAAINLLENDKVDAVVGDGPVIRYYMKEIKYRGSYQVIDKNMYSDNCVIGVPKSQKDLVPVLNKAIFMLRKNGTINNINNKWLSLPEENIKKNTEKLKLITSIGLLLAFISAYTVYMWNRSLKNLVNIKTNELESTKKELEITFNGIKEYIVILDGEGIVKNLNKAYLKNISMKLSEVIGKSYKDLQIINDFEKKYDGIVEKLLDSSILNEKDTFENLYELKSSGRIYSVKIYPLEHKPYTIGRIAIMIEDITSIRMNQEKLTQENKMSAIGQLAAGVAHELRNPLGIIRNSTFLLHEGWDDEDLRTMAIDSIDNSIERSSKIINNLLNFSRKNIDSYEKINLRELIGEVCVFFKSNTVGNSKKIIINVDKELNINTNSTSLRHILMNLIQNAIDAIEEKGQIIISTDVKEDEIILKVEDNGSGIGETEISKIFEPFYTTKEIGKGTGLGLYIVYTEVSKLRGEITAASNMGRTVFTLKLPLIIDSLTVGDEKI